MLSLFTRPCALWGLIARRCAIRINSTEVPGTGGTKESFVLFDSIPFHAEWIKASNELCSVLLENALLFLPSSRASQ
ncbi:hypothetical protein CEXT_346661 [Caerostris extrusa]|uniref:Secreted protein n=1 Tax=Caerostris extrusa TaxID=172846 RepID=A0AAV4P1L1_CAEEX|nr:hypothetical protein CEXT_346661 [Caerostris extrusa]